MIQTSDLASPGGVAPGQCHCSQRPELTRDPSSSAKHVVGNWKTVVWISLVGVVIFAVIFPEAGRLCLQRVHAD